MTVAGGCHREHDSGAILKETMTYTYTRTHAHTHTHTRVYIHTKRKHTWQRQTRQENPESVYSHAYGLHQYPDLFGFKLHLYVSVKLLLDPTTCSQSIMVFLDRFRLIVKLHFLLKMTRD